MTNKILNHIEAKSKELYFEHSKIVWSATEKNKWSLEIAQKLAELEAKQQILESILPDLKKLIEEETKNA